MNGSKFTKQLLDWYDANSRELPWRHNPEPYPVWVSEIMAQQTQIDRVIGYFERWMRKFPTLKALSQAHEEDVLKLWEGLGYYSRARNMLKTACVIAHDHGGFFPSDPQIIRSLPGIGEYTAGAISSIAFSLPEPAVDANVLRVFSRLLDVDTPVRDAASRARIEKQVRLLIPEDRPGDFNQAIMEFGALVCTKRPACDRCLMQGSCLAYERGTVAERPVLPPSKKSIRIDMATGVLVHEGKVLIQKRRPDDVWPGLWEFPGGGIEQGETPKQAVVREYMEEVSLHVEPVGKITVVSYSYTKYRVTMHCYLCKLSNSDMAEPVFNEAVEGCFVFWEELSKYAFPAGHRRLIEFMKNDIRYNDDF